MQEKALVAHLELHKKVVKNAWILSYEGRKVLVFNIILCRGHPPVSGRPPKIAIFSTGGISPSVPLSAVPASVVFCNHALLHGTHGKGL